MIVHPDYTIYGTEYTKLNYTGDTFSIPGLLILSSFFSEDGTKMFVKLHNAGVRQYSLSTPWQLAGAVYEKNSNIFIENGHQIVFSPDGGHLYYRKTYNWDVDCKIYSHKLEVPWDVGTLLPAVTFQPDQLGDAQAFAIVQDGASMFCEHGPNIAKYNLALPYDITSATFVDEFENPQMGIAFSKDGKYFFNFIEDRYLKMTRLGIQFDLSSEVKPIIDSVDLSPAATVAGNFNSLFFKPDDESKLFFANYQPHIYCFDLTQPPLIGYMEILT